MSVEDRRVLVLAPAGRDAVLAENVLRREGIDAKQCRDTAHLCDEVRRGAAALLIAEEALPHDRRAELIRCIQEQPAWSDLPVLVMASAQHTHVSPDGLVALSELGNVTVLQRPMHVVVLLTAIRSALRARKRQAEVRDLLGKLERGVRDRDAFLATLGHELRNPLAAIRNALELLDRARRPDEASERERVILRRQAHHLGHLVDDLLDVARVTKGKIVLQRSGINFADIVRRGVEAVELGDRSGHDFRVDLASEPVYVDGDPVRLEQVVSNLLTNAVKYTPAGGRIDVSCSAVSGQAVLEVRDQGVGLAPDMISRIFDLFTQAERSLDRSQGGLGIGLTLVRSLVELHGGTIDAASDGVGRGTSFRVQLPLIERPVNEAAEPAPPTESSSAVHRVLLVEDNDDIRETLAMLLSVSGFEVSSANDGPSGVAEAERTEPDAALIDIGLPGFDGYEVARRLRMTRPKLVLVALTGYGQPDDRRRSQEAGFDAHLTKPIDIDVLTSLLKWVGVQAADAGCAGSLA
ncbi:MAG: hybrid sensor histidine kinase/response regulator [Polyangiales bacterium]